MSLLFLQVYFEFEYYSKHQAIQLIEEQLVTLSSFDGSENSDQSFQDRLNSGEQSRFRDLAMDIQDLSPGLLLQTRTHLIDLEKGLRSLDEGFASRDEARLLDAKSNIMFSMLKLSETLLSYDSGISQSAMTIRISIIGLLIGILVFSATSINRTFNSISSRYNRMIRRLMARNRLSNLSAKKAVEAHQRVLDLVKHELRTPVSTVIGCLELMTNSKTEADRIALIRRGRAASFHLLHEVDAIAQSTDVNNRNLILNSTPFALTSLIDQSASEFSVNIRHEGIQFDAQFDSPLDYIVSIDGQKFKTCISTLLAMAKYLNVSKSILLSVNILNVSNQKKLSIRITSDAARFGQVEFDDFWTLAKNFDNIAENQGLKKLPLFKKYNQVFNADVATKITTNSLDIRWTLPIDAYALNWHKEDSTMLSRRYAVVDNLSISRDLIATLITSAGGQVSVFNSGKELLAALRKGESFYTIILDVHMPDFSGIETLEMMRAMYKASDVPVILVSADAEILHEAMSENNTIQQVFCKPIDGQRLLDTLFSIENPKIANSKKALKTLLVEDDSISAEFVAHMLQSIGYSVEVAGTGEEARELISNKIFDVALIDLNLPDESGYDIARFIKQNTPKSQRPIMLALTGNTEDTDKLESKKAGMKYHICKPVSLEELKKSIQLSVHLQPSED